MNGRQERRRRRRGRDRVVVVVNEWLWGMLVCFTFFSKVVYRSAFLICFEVACSVVVVSKHVSLLLL